jgi:hypothetical protein
MLGWLDGDGIPVILEPGDDYDVRRTTWDRLRAALGPLAEAPAGSDLAAFAGRVRDVIEARILRHEAGEALPDTPDGRLSLVAGRADVNVIACAFVLDELRRLNEDERIAGELGWAMRRWARAELQRALAQLADEEPDVHRRAARDAEALLRASWQPSRWRR